MYGRKATNAYIRFGHNNENLDPFPIFKVIHDIATHIRGVQEQAKESMRVDHRYCSLDVERMDDLRVHFLLGC